MESKTAHIFIDRLGIYTLRTLKSREEHSKAYSDPVWDISMNAMSVSASQRLLLGIWVDK